MKLNFVLNSLKNLTVIKLTSKEIRRLHLGFTTSKCNNFIHYVSWDIEIQLNQHWYGTKNISLASDIDTNNTANQLKLKANAYKWSGTGGQNLPPPVPFTSVFFTPASHPFS